LFAKSPTDDLNGSTSAAIFPCFAEALDKMILEGDVKMM
jgi:hypothetical protein